MSLLLYRIPTLRVLKRRDRDSLRLIKQNKTKRNYHSHTHKSQIFVLLLYYEQYGRTRSVQVGSRDTSRNRGSSVRLKGLARGLNSTLSSLEVLPRPRPGLNESECKRHTGTRSVNRKGIKSKKSSFYLDLNGWDVPTILLICQLSHSVRIVARLLSRSMGCLRQFSTTKSVVGTHKELLCNGNDGVYRKVVDVDLLHGYSDGYTRGNALDPEPPRTGSSHRDREVVIVSESI